MVAVGAYFFHKQTLAGGKQIPFCFQTRLFRPAQVQALQTPVPQAISISSSSSSSDNGVEEKCSLPALPDRVTHMSSWSGRKFKNIGITPNPRDVIVAVKDERVGGVSVTRSSTLRTVRQYHTAKADIVVGDTTMKSSLQDEKSLIVFLI